MEIYTGNIIRSIDEITPETIDLVYYLVSRLHGQRITRVCMDTSHTELFDLLLRLGDQYAAELANILCTETSRHRKRFTKRNITSEHFVLYRKDLPIFRIMCEQYISPLRQDIVVACAEYGMRSHPRKFRKLPSIVNVSMIMQDQT